VLCPDADNSLAFSVKGPAVLLANDAGDPTSHVPFYSTSLPAFHGKASAIIRRTGPGQITVSAKSSGIKTATLVLK
jgi:beta-galactosidase